MTSPAQILRNSDAVLLDFDGPVCSVFGGFPDHEVADELRGLFRGELPEAVGESRDPFDVLRYAAGAGTVATTVEQHLRDLEVRAVKVASPTPGTAQVLETLHDFGIPVFVVSNNSAAAVSAYFEAHGMAGLIAGVSARTGPEVDQLKPKPYLLKRAIEALETAPGRCVMIGDSETDLEASRHAGTLAIGYANKLGKRQRFEQYRPNAIIDHMHELARGTPPRGAGRRGGVR
ncbi:HAD-IA family hydrolase [Saccharopolyspora taberi]|uniref:HAD family hydrolase n=1 Tax=Saccharopolyspora taberi TaxID=60895 RepID=A0ABN3VL63_9PSEU